MSEDSDTTLIPRDAWTAHGHWLCRLLRHTGLGYATDVERISETGRRTTLIEAECMQCGRAQPKIRVIYPPSYTITVQRSPGESAT